MALLFWVSSDSVTAAVGTKHEGKMALLFWVSSRRRAAERTTLAPSAGR
jgi:hypothetical protein